MMAFSDLEWLSFWLLRNWRLKAFQLVFISGQESVVPCWVSFVLFYWVPCLPRLNHLFWVDDPWWFPSLFLSSFSTGVIAVVIFIIFSIIGIMTRFLYQHKQSHRTNQMKEKEYPENLDSSFRNDIDLQNTVSECKREYFIWETAGSPNILWVVVKFFLLSPIFSFWSSSFSHLFANYVWHTPVSTTASILLTQPRRPGSYGHCLPFRQSYGGDSDHSTDWLYSRQRRDTWVYMCIFSSIFPVSK